MRKKNAVSCAIIALVTLVGCEGSPVGPNTAAQESGGVDAMVAFSTTQGPRGLEALWLFNGTGRDLTGNHPCELIGNATFGYGPGRRGLHTEDASGYARYNPPIQVLSSGRISCWFTLDETFAANPAFNNPIILIKSNRAGHHTGDFSVRLDPSDGKLWLVQEQDASTSTLNLKTQKANWPAGTYHVTIRWGANGREIWVAWAGGCDRVSDSSVSACFAADATEPWIASRAGDSPTTGLTIHHLAVWGVSGSAKPGVKAPAS
ncbi:MAG: hypothetical protein OEY32_16050 [Candidatus Krumholzibacteria bacterium]|nr:hypothetical protein [Candidatus Krumholzibacteria bacterium]MDH5271428.1 hypothetical protein [Candidatus Krumholzibacteria bacterium]